MTSLNNSTGDVPQDDKADSRRLASRELISAALDGLHLNENTGQDAISKGSRSTEAQVPAGSSSPAKLKKSLWATGSGEIPPLSSAGEMSVVHEPDRRLEGQKSGQRKYDAGRQASQPLYASPTAGYGAPCYGQSPYAFADNEHGIFGKLTPFGVFRTLRKKWLVVLLVFLFVNGAASFYLWKAAKVYRAASLIELSLRRPRIAAQQGAVLEDQAQGTQSEEIFNTRLEKIRSETMVKSAVKRYQAVNPGSTNTEALLDIFKKKAKFTLLRKTRLVKIEVENTDPEFAAGVCNAFVAAVEASSVDENRASSDSAVVWLQSQAQEKRKELDKADQQLMKFREDNRADALDSQRKTVEQAMFDFNKDLVEIQSKEAKAKEIVSALASVQMTPENAGSLPDDTPNAAEISTAKTKWLAAISERDGLLAKLKPKHPEMIAKETAVRSYRADLSTVLKHASETAAANLALLNRQAESLRRKAAEQEKLASDLETQIIRTRMQISALERERNACEASYRGILTRIEEARLAADENTAAIKVIERAAEPTRPVRPVPSRIIAMAIVLGLMAGVGLALVTDTLEDRVVDAHDIEAATGVKTIAVIPHVEGRHDRGEIATACVKQRFPQVAEAFAGLRSLLDSAAYKGTSKVVLALSSIPAEGKTTTACNLATVCAKSGQKTLLVDFDLRRPRIAGIYPMPPGNSGLLDYLGREDVSVADIVYSADSDNLDLIASRPTPGAGHAELVGSNKVVDLIAWARDNYDRVVIDAPPLGLISDGIVLAGLSDCVLIMIRAEVSRRRAVCHTIQRLRDAGVGTLAIVINDMDFSKATAHGYGPYYNYHSHYEAYVKGADDADSINHPLRSEKK